jgi:transposase
MVNYNRFRRCHEWDFFVLHGLLNRLGDDLKFLDMGVESIDREIKALCKL